MVSASMVFVSGFNATSYVDLVGVSRLAAAGAAPFDAFEVLLPAVPGSEECEHAAKEAIRPNVRTRPALARRVAAADVLVVIFY